MRGEVDEEAGTLEEGALHAVLRGTHGDPFAVLGPHGGRLRVFAPDASEVTAMGGGRELELTCTHGEGMFECDWEGPYRLRMRAGDNEWERGDAYAHGPVLSDMDEYLIAEGTHEALWEALGAHPRDHEGAAGTSFAVWAPNASRVSVVGHFNAWDGRRHVMRRRGAGLWEIFVPDIGRGELYKYEIMDGSGHLLPLKADPMGFAAEAPPAQGSLVAGLPTHEWKHERVAAADPRSAPMSVYEVHLGSWRRGEGDKVLSYAEIGPMLAEYAVSMGFTHVELLPVAEHPYTPSWGYQPIGLFAPTARFGTPAEFAAMIDTLHGAGIGVIVDWVPAHFPSDAHGLARFDGTALYEHEDPRLGFHKDWNTLIYNFGRTEVANFLRASAVFWLREYRIDALRVDAVASMLYLDYSREAGEWVPNAEGGRENLEAIAFLKRTNDEAHRLAPGSLMIAEESTAFPGVTAPVADGGLGFDFKWNMGWMNDTLRYMGEDPAHRRWHHHLMTFGLHYAFSEAFVLPISHDEVVHGKGSMIGKMPGDPWQAFANLRAYYGWMWAHPGKQLLFMGQEFGQRREWSEGRSLDWHEASGGPQAGVQALVRDLNALMAAEPALHALDADPAGFEWIDGGAADENVLSLVRRGPEGTRPIVALVNMAPVLREGYRTGLPLAGTWTEVLNTDAAPYGGSDAGNGGTVLANGEGMHGQPASAVLTLPPLAVLFLAPEGA